MKTDRDKRKEGWRYMEEGRESEGDGGVGGWVGGRDGGLIGETEERT